jgi:hypothetical protein
MPLIMITRTKLIVNFALNEVFICETALLFLSI